VLGSFVNPGMTTLLPAWWPAHGVRRIRGFGARMIWLQLMPFAPSNLAGFSVVYQGAAGGGGLLRPRAVSVLQRTMWADVSVASITMGHFGYRCGGVRKPLSRSSQLLGWQLRTTRLGWTNDVVSGGSSGVRARRGGSSWQRELSGSDVCGACRTDRCGGHGRGKHDALEHPCPRKHET
jgi:hypothetical protein